MNGAASLASLKRYGSAFAVSILCHGVVVLGILPRILVTGSAASPRISVTIRDAGIGGGESGSGGGGEPAAGAAGRRDEPRPANGDAVSHERATEERKEVRGLVHDTRPATALATRDVRHERWSRTASSRRRRDRRERAANVARSDARDALAAPPAVAAVNGDHDAVARTADTNAALGAAPASRGSSEGDGSTTGDARSAAAGGGRRRRCGLRRR